MAKTRINSSNFKQEGWTTEQIFVNPTNNQKEIIQDSQFVTIECPPGNSHNPGSHNGAVCFKMTSQTDTATRVLRRLRLRNGKQTHLLAEITTLKYSTFIVNNKNQSAPSLVLQIEKAPNQFEGIFFDPRLQPGTSVLLNQWQEWDTLAGRWAKETDPTNFFRLATYVAQNPNAKIFNNTPTTPQGGGGIRFTVGGDPAADFKDFLGFVDGFTINRIGTSVNPGEPVNTPNQLLVYDFDCVHEHERPDDTSAKVSSAVSG
jgi:hypothetical protein